MATTTSSTTGGGTETQQQQQVAPAPRSRRVVMTDEVMEGALQMANNGKVSSKNAWDVKLLEGMEGSVQQWMGQREDQDQYKQFQKAATLVEGGAKVWTYRVENIYSLSNQMLQRLLRNDTRAIEDDDEATGEDGAATQQTQHRRKKKTLERTVAVNTEEIDLDTKQQAGGNEAVSAMFRAMTEKFDQSHAQGLLLNNCPMGTAGNIILDRNLATSAGPELDLAVNEPIHVNWTRNSQEFQSSSPHLKIPYARPAGAAQDPNATTATEGNATRASSVKTERDARNSGNSDNLAPQNINEALQQQNNEMDDDDYDNGDFGGYDDMGGGDDEDDAVPPGDLSRVGSMARGLVSGMNELDHLDKLALEVENPQDWVPLTETAASQGASQGLFGRRNIGGVPQSQLLTDIRRKCALPKAVKEAADGEDAPAVGKKRSRTGKTVTFAAATQQPDAAANDDQQTETQPTTLLEDLKMNKTQTTALLPFGTQLLKENSKGTLQMYTSVSYCEKQAKDAKNRIVDTERLALFNIKRKKTSHTFEQLTGAQILHGSTHHSDLNFSKTRNFYQPFCTSKPHWNVLKKTARHIQAAEQDTAHVTRYRADGEGGGYDDDEQFAVMPNDIFDGDMGYDDMNDGPDGDDYIPDLEAPAGFFPAAGDELPDLGDGGGEGGEGPVLLEGPETVKALKINRATIPTQVDVVRLRRCMWDSTSRLVAPPHPQNESENPNNIRDHGLDDDEDLDAIDRVHIDPDSTETFASVVADTLPKTPQFSKDGSLSPAFFFFSMLFLANEHSLELKSSADDALDDIQMKRRMKPGEGTVH